MFSKALFSHNILKAHANKKSISLWLCEAKKRSDLEELEEVIGGHILAGKVRASCLIYRNIKLFMFNWKQQ